MSNINRFKIKFGDRSYHTNKKNNLVRFIHASDIHLGSHQYRSDFRSNDFIRAFEEILIHGISNRADFILLCGDVFTSLEMLPGNLTNIVKILTDFNEYTNRSILLIAIEGNHDIRKFSRGVRFEKRGQSWLKLLSSLGLLLLLDVDIEAPYEKLFEPYNFSTNKGGMIRIKNVVIYGTRYLGERPTSQLCKIRKAIKKCDGSYNILLQHFGIEGQMENVPGVNLMDIQSLRHRVDYLALGHFHKQFILEDWIYNPGSSEAVCSIDNSFKRGIFLVELSEECGNFIKNVKIIRLVNRNYIWKTLHFNFEIRNKMDFEELIITKLKASLTHLNYQINPSNPKIPTLYLILKGKKPSNSFKISEKDLRKKLCEILPIVDVKIYQKFGNSLRTLDNYLLEQKSLV
ncbi:MAG: exonuclease SbcCD subunit D [Candidatus Hodarchaeota archaeon]